MHFAAAQPIINISPIQLPNEREMEQTSGSSATVELSRTATTAHLLQARRIPPAAAAVVLGVLAHREGVGAAPLAFDPVVVGGAIYVVDSYGQGHKI